MNLIEQDKLARQQALDPEQSFIVQAPAGSGKTELLTQRYLKLLSVVPKAPQQILAITFTRKAAAEMRERILHALELAQSSEPPQEAHKQQTWQLAKDALARNEKLGWQLLKNPNQLRIMTLDSLCANLSARLPILSQFGAQPSIADDAFRYYEQAAQQIIASLDDDNSWTQHLETLLLHLDNRAYRLQKLFTSILARRDQWLPHIVGLNNNLDELQKLLEQGLSNVAIELMLQVKQQLSDIQQQELIACANYAAQYFTENDPDHLLTCCAGIHTLPEVTPETMDQWRALANMLLTKQGTWRRSITKREGFPAKTDAKQRLLNLLANIADNDALRTSLDELRNCPPLHYDQAQWQIIQAIIVLLPILTAHLHVTFQEHNVVDFIELNLAALRALGDESNPTDLSLYLDHQIQHILVDEFQDTSISQFTLLERLMAGWQPNDGRSVFFVGDPMQSIYRFRNAEVGLFLRTKQQGIADVKLEFLSLKRNFRSLPAIVAWTNDIYKEIFPQQADIALGAVPYTDAVANQVDLAEGNIEFIPTFNQDDEQQAQHAVQIIQQCLAKNPQASIVILVRSRSHLLAIAPALRAANLAYQAIDIEPLSARMEILDLLSLTRALYHLADRIAWLAILRAPWCGLSLQDLHSIALAADSHTIFEAIQNYESLAITDDGKQRLQRVVPVLVASLQQRSRLQHVAWIKGTWFSLGGPATLRNQDELNNASSYFELIAKITQQHNQIDFRLLEDELHKLFAKPEQAQQANIQLMTIHKSKGLEFDHVILPSLERLNPSEPSHIMLWQERPSAFGSNDLLLAPIKSADADHDPMYDYLRRVEKRKLDLEMARLLYVATTRAKKSLHLIANIKYDTEQGDIQLKANKGSFLALLWPHYHQQIEQQLHGEQQVDDPEIEIDYDESTLYRLATDWQAPHLANGFAIEPSHFIDTLEGNAAVKPLDFDKNNARILGTVIHRIIESIEHLDPHKFDTYKPRWRAMLTEAGYSFKQIEHGIQSITTAVDNFLQDAKAQWILSTRHTDAHNEYQLSAFIDDQVKHVILDRTFIDNNGIRWIIDYKTSTPKADQDINEFLHTEREQYQEQLNTYAEVLKEIDNRPIRLGLYFPLAKAWCEWEKP